MRTVFFIPGDLSAHEGLGKNLKSGDTKRPMGGVSEALRDIWRLQAPQCIGAANQPSC